MAVYFLNDLLVGLPSQLGYSSFDKRDNSYGFHTYTECFKSDDYSASSPKKCSDNSSPGIVHNLEARDSEMIDYILENIVCNLPCDGYCYYTLPSGNVKITSYTGPTNVTSITIPSTLAGHIVTEIGPSIFGGNITNLTSITIPSSVEKIHSRAFLGISTLENVNIGSGSNLVYIGDAAFANCPNLSSFNSNSYALSLPEDVEHVGEYAFYGTGFEDIEINENLSYIGECAFAMMTDLISITVDNLNSSFVSVNNCLYSLDGELIQYALTSGIPHYYVLSSVNNVDVYKIRDCAFMEAVNLEEVTIPSTVEIIGNNAFKGCVSLYNVEMGNAVEQIGVCAFEGCDYLGVITIPSSVKYIGDCAFKDCSSLSDVVISRAQLPLTTIGKNAFLGCDSSLIIEVNENRVPDYKGKDDWQPYKNKVTPISSYTSYNLYGYSNITVSPSISAGNNKLYKIDVKAQNAYQFIATASDNLVIKLYNSNMALQEESDGAIRRILYNNNVCYISIEFEDLEDSGTVSLNIKKDTTHVHTYNSIWFDNTKHRRVCACSYNYLEGHAVSPDAFNNGNMYATCLICGGNASIGIMPTGVNQLPHTLNGSFILPNGVVVLASDDYEDYINGNLVFIYPDGNSMFNIENTIDE